MVWLSFLVEFYFSIVLHSHLRERIFGFSYWTLYAAKFNKINCPIEWLSPSNHTNTIILRPNFYGGRCKCFDSHSILILYLSANNSKSTHDKKSDLMNKLEESARHLYKVYARIHILFCDVTFHIIPKKNAFIHHQLFAYKFPFKLTIL